MIFGRLKASLSAFNFQVVAKAGNTLNNIIFSRLKDKVPQQLISGVVYAVKCEREKIYIGNTGQHIIQRLKQHQRGDANHSALAALLHNTNHIIDFDNVAICCIENNRRAREVKEMIYIKTTENINQQIDCAALSDCYNLLLNKLSVKLPFV